MIKQYSDLSDKQKIIYIKRGIVISFFTFIPVIIWCILLFTTIGTMVAPTLNTNPTSTDIETSRNTETTSDIGGKMVLFLIVFFTSLFGIIELSGNIGAYVADKLKLYTDFQLEYHEKKLKEIKESLN